MNKNQRTLCAAPSPTNKGTVLLGVIMVIGLLTSIMIGGLMNLAVLQRLSQNLLHGHAAILRARSNALLAFDAQAGQGTTTGYVCADQSTTVGRMNHTALACGFLNTATPTPQIADGEITPLFLALDWEDVLRDKSPCQSTTNQSTKRSPLGFPLSAAAFVAATNCEVSKLRPRATMHESNVVIAGSVTTPGTKAAPYRIASPGFIDINGALELTSDTIIIAGGDIRLHSVRTTGSAQRRLTVISLTGTVVIHALTSKVFIKVAAAEGAYLPPPPITGDNELLPPLPKGDVIGFSG